MIDDEVINYLIFHGREERNLEYKRSISWADIDVKVKIAKTVMAMANISGGGFIVVGIEKSGEIYLPVGMEQEHIDSFKQDDVMTWVNEYADPYVELTVLFTERDKKQYLIIDISEFDQLPIVCKKNGQHLRRGDIFTRSRRRYETARIGSQNEIREILNLTVDKEIRLRGHQFRTFEKAFNTNQNDRQLFEQQGKEL